MENEWASWEDEWRRKVLKGEPIDFTVYTKDKAVFEKQGEEFVEKYKIQRHLAPLPHQGDYANCTTLFLLGHMQSPGYDLLSPEFTPEKLDLYFSNLLQRPLQEGEPIRGLSTSFGRGWWINKKLKHILNDLVERFGKTPEEALRIVQEMIAIQQVHSYAMSVDATGAQFEPAALRKTMGYSLALAKQAIERGVLVVVLARWSHWDKVLNLSGRPNLKLIRLKKSATQHGIPNINEKVIDPETSTATYNDLLVALGRAPNATPASQPAEGRSKPVATLGTPAKSEARKGQKGRQTNAEASTSAFVDLTNGTTLLESPETARPHRGKRKEATTGPSAVGQATPAIPKAEVTPPPPNRRAKESGAAETRREGKKPKREPSPQATGPSASGDILTLPSTRAIIDRLNVGGPTALVDNVVRLMCEVPGQLANSLVGPKLQQWAAFVPQVGRLARGFGTQAAPVDNLDLIKAVSDLSAAAAAVSADMAVFFQHVAFALIRGKPVARSIGEYRKQMGLPDGEESDSEDEG